MPLPRLIRQLEVDAALERQRLIDGLRRDPAFIEPKYFYDALGCAIYGAICQLEEYYPTRTERAIFDVNRTAIAEVIGRVDAFVDLGAGDCAKAIDWLRVLQPSRYVAVDIAEATLVAALNNMSGEFPDVEMIGLVTDFSHELKLSAALTGGKTTLFYPGSSIGNFSPDDAVRFLIQLRPHASNGLLIGVDAKKSNATLDAAYDDALGVTAAFNLNALRHINRVLSSDFDCADWRHVAFYSAERSRVEMHLEARRDVIVAIDGSPRIFNAGDRIHSENSYKYSREEFEDILQRAGFAVTQCWTDANTAFWVFFAK
jgi:dimethylhistidine N-methyltransferase